MARRPAIAKPLAPQAACCLQETGHFLETQDDRYLARLVNMAHLCGHLGVLEGGPEEKLQRCDPGVEIAAGDALFNQVQLITPEIFGSGGIRRTLQKAGEVDNTAQIRGLGFRRELAHRHVFDHAFAQRTDLFRCVSHGSAPLLRRGELPHFST